MHDFTENDIKIIGQYINEGDARLAESLAPAYDMTISYNVGSVMTYDKRLYRCTAATTGEFDPTKWSRITEKQLIDNATSNLQTEIAAKQDALVSGTNIKSINNTTLLGSGNMNINSIEVLTTAPSAINTGLTKIVHLATNPATKYDGYIYLIDEE